MPDLNEGHLIKFIHHESTKTTKRQKGKIYLISCFRGYICYFVRYGKDFSLKEFNNFSANTHDRS
jgi:hypothetical protein